MTLHRFILHPRSPWRTPWLADTLTSRLALEGVRLHGRSWMLEQLQRPALAGKPRFVLSDACPGDLLPMPASMKLAPVRAHHLRALKHCHWVPRDTFLRWQRGVDTILDADLNAAHGLHDVDRWHNSLSRFDMRTDEDGNLFASTETSFDPSAIHSHLSVYASVADAESLTLLTDLFHSLADAGFGADSSSGAGAFSVDEHSEAAGWLQPQNQTPTTSILSLSSYQPKAQDPTRGCWECFVKHGKFSTDAPKRESTGIFWQKPPQLMLKAGAVFETSQSHTHVGRLIKVGEAQDDDEGLMQFALGLVISGNWPSNLA